MQTVACAYPFMMFNFNGVRLLAVCIYKEHWCFIR